jgi:Ca2+-binding EF-hand superfamily protein
LAGRPLYILKADEIGPIEQFPEDVTMKKQIVTGAALLIFAMTTAPAIAGHGHGHGKGHFMTFFDTNNDGVVNMAEFEAAATERFKRMDADGSGVVSKDEFHDYMRVRRDERKQNRFERMDTNGNSMVERDEFLAYKQQKAERRFTRMDKNGDGSVSKEEYASCQKRKHNKGRMLKRMDENGDGQISQNESLSAWSNWFKRIDTNSDQVVSADEIKAYRNRIHGKTRGGK